MTRVDPDAVLDAVSTSALGLGYDGANLAILEHGATTFTPTHTRGLAKALEGKVFRADQGLTAQVVAQRTVVVASDYSSIDGGSGRSPRRGSRAWSRRRSSRARTWWAC